MGHSRAAAHDGAGSGAAGNRARHQRVIAGNGGLIVGRGLLRDLIPGARGQVVDGDALAVFQRNRLAALDGAGLGAGVGVSAVSAGQVHGEGEFLRGAAAVHGLADDQRALTLRHIDHHGGIAAPGAGDGAGAVEIVGGIAVGVRLQHRICGTHREAGDGFGLSRPQLKRLLRVAGRDQEGECLVLVRLAVQHVFGHIQRAGGLIFDLVGHSGPGEVLGLDLPAVTVHRIQHSALVGEQEFAARQLLAVFIQAVLVICAVYADLQLGIGQPDLVGQLDLLEVGDGHIDLPHEALVGLTVPAILIVVQDIEIVPGTILLLKSVSGGLPGVAVRRDRFRQRCHFQFFAVYLQGQAVRVVDEIKVIGEPVRRAVGSLADDIHNFGAPAHQIVDVVLDRLEADFLAAGQVVHEGRAPEVLGAAVLARCHGVAVIAFRLGCLIHLVGQVQRFVDGVGVGCLPVLLRRGLADSSFIGVLILGSLRRDLLTDAGKPVAPVPGGVIGAVLGVPVVRSGPVFPSIRPECPGGDSGLCAVHVGDRVADEDQILAAIVHLGVIIQHGLACQQARVGVRAAFDLLPDRFLDCLILFGQVKELASVGNMGLLVEDDHADLNFCAGSVQPFFQAAEHRQCLILDIGAGGLIQHQHHITDQLFLGGRQGQRHIGGIIALAVFHQIRSRLGFGDIPLRNDRSRLRLRQKSMGGFQGFLVPDGRQAVFAKAGKLINIEAVFIMRFPAASRRIVIPAVDGIVAMGGHAVQTPAFTDTSERDRRASLVVNVVAGGHRVVVINDRVGRDDQCALVPDAAARGVVLYAILFQRFSVPNNGQIGALIKDVTGTCGVTTQAHAVVVSDIDRHIFADVCIADQPECREQVVVVSVPRIPGQRQLCGVFSGSGGACVERSADVQAGITIVEPVKNRILENHIAGGKAMAPVVQKFDL